MIKVLVNAIFVIILMSIFKSFFIILKYHNIKTKQDKAPAKGTAYTCTYLIIATNTNR